MHSQKSTIKKKKPGQASKNQQAAGPHLHLPSQFFFLKKVEKSFVLCYK